MEGENTNENREQQLPSQTEKAERLPPLIVLGWTVEYVSGGKRITVDQKNRLVVINKEGITDQTRLRQLGAWAVAREEALIEFARGANPKEALKFFSEDKAFVREFFRLVGARLLKERDPKIAQEISGTLPAADSATTEFKTACALYLTTGEFPPTTEAVGKELSGLPISPKTGQHLLEDFTSERVTLSRKRDYFERFIAPAMKRLQKVDADLHTSESEDFQPSTDDSPDKRELDESEILQRVEPFFGGYFREKVMDGVDWESMRVVASGVPSEKLLPPEESRVITEGAKVHKFKGSNGQDFSRGELSMALPASAEIFPETAVAGLAIRRSTNGTHTLVWMGEGEPPAKYEFDFERKAQPQDWQRTGPTETERGVPSLVVETLSAGTRTFIEQLRNAHLTDAARVRQIVHKVQTTIEYVNDSSVGEMLAAAGGRYLATLEEIKKGDCDVSNFYALAQIRALDIPCRMITGYYVRRDKRFSFAALAGDKHAWLEWWNKDTGLWERVDATPPKQSQDEAEKDNEEGGGGQEKELGVSNTEEPKVVPEESDEDPFGLPFEEDDLKRLAKQLSLLPENVDTALATGQIFENLYGISRERWNEVRAFAEAVGRERLPLEATIDGRASSTVSEEWKRIFDLLLIAYRLPDHSRRVMGRQSQGGELADTVSAGIDVLSGSDDPYGYQTRERREQTEKLPIRFSNDFILDVTASMEAKNNQGKSLLELERQFVLSSLYEGYRLNERVKQMATGLSVMPLITNHILSIHGGAKWQEILKTAPATLKELSAVNEAMKKSTVGAGAMAEALEHYLQTLEQDAATLAALKNGEMVKTLTILTDGNLWCSECGKESCNYQLHGPALARVNKALKKVRGFGVIINAIGFTQQSRQVAELFAVPGDPEAAVIVESLGGALAAHHRQTIRAMRPVVEAAKKRIKQDIP